MWRFRLWVVVALAAYSSLLPAPDYPLGLSIFDFAPTHCFHQVVRNDSDLIPHVIFYVRPDGTSIPITYYRFRHTDSALVGETGFSSERGTYNRSIFGELQRPALLAMLRLGYISKTLYDALVSGAGSYEPQQLKYAVLWSDLSLPQTKELFGGTIPWERVMRSSDREKEKRESSTNTVEVSAKAAWEVEEFPTAKLGEDENVDEWWGRQRELWERKWPGEQKLRIVRAGALLVMGQIPDPLSGALKPVPMSWQKTEEHKAVADVDRNLYPMAAEVSRALSEEGVLPGSFTYPLQAILAILREEADLRGIPPARVGIFSRALDPVRARRFAMFGMRRWTSGYKQRVEALGTTVDDAVSHAASDPLPRKGDDFDEMMMTSLSEAMKHIPLTDLSSHIDELRQLTNSSITHSQARELRDQTHSLMWSNLYFPGVPEQGAPIFILDRSFLPLAFVGDNAVRMGIPPPQVNALLNALMTGHKSELNLHDRGRWLERGYVLPMLFAPKRLQNTPYVRIDNISERAARAHPAFVASVLVSLRQKLLDEVISASPRAGGIMVEALQQMLSNPPDWVMNPNLYPSVSAEVLLDQISIIVATTSPVVRDRLAALGGRIHEQQLVEAPEPQFELTGSSFSMGYRGGFKGKGYIVLFTQEQLRQVEATMTLEDRFQATCTEELRRLAVLQRIGQF